MPQASAVKGQGNYGFTASTNQDETFLDKCRICRSALEKADVDTLTSFVNPDFLAKIAKALKMRY